MIAGLPNGFGSLVTATVYRCISTKMQHTTTVKSLNFGCKVEGETNIFAEAEVVRTSEGENTSMCSGDI